MKHFSSSILFVVISFLAIPADAAISASTTLEVRPSGSDTNGGGFVTGASGTDLSLFDNRNAAGCTSCQSATVNISTTDAVTANTTTVTSATANFSSALIGNLIYLTGSGTTTGWYQVTAVGSSVSITVDRATGSTGGTGVTLNIGGGLASPGQAAAIKVAGNNVFIKSGTYSITTASTNVAGGMVSDTTGGTGPTVFTHWTGYNTNRTLINTDTKPILQASGSISSFTILNSGSSSYTRWHNLSVDCASKTTSTGANAAGAYAQQTYLKAVNCTAIGVANGGGTNAWMAYIEASGGSGTAGIQLSNSVQGAFLESHGNTTHGIQMGFNSTCFMCGSWSNSGGSSDGFNPSSVALICMNCWAYGNGRYGFNLTGTGYGSLIVNSIAEANANIGFASGGVIAGTTLINDASYNNNSTTSLSGQYSNTDITLVFGFINVTVGSVFTNAAGGDFSLNSTASRGALLRAAAFPSASPDGTLNYRDIGFAQHQDSGGSSVTVGYPIVQ